MEQDLHIVQLSDHFSGKGGIFISCYAGRGARSGRPPRPCLRPPCSPFLRAGKPRAWKLDVWERKLGKTGRSSGCSNLQGPSGDLFGPPSHKEGEKTKKKKKVRGMALGLKRKPASDNPPACEQDPRFKRSPQRRGGGGLQK